ncbi:hypothetical protein GH876_11945 [Bacillus thuringiensis]|uniref:hypothetical protein n=1 Tax=Bacillus cereus group TaxID=86661 RepID=UPI00132C7D47|nr:MULTISPECIES: hypothetical protein [Bacillus cereus group]MEB8648348.1 hypothetical protein [Bacillus cereus]MDR5045919.1 hypothetical protein [Bacillus thuringiensis]MEB8667956.1 hypothetical protein [Bacillus cereus]MEB8713234.1 hypothetical protein [Bacillus cereus]MEB9162873.1 hypothetical protein [Bacillus cereus]
MNEEKKYFHKAKCLVCGHMDKVYHPSKEEYQEVTVCPKCNGAFVDVWVMNKYTQKSNDAKKNIQGLTIELNVETTEALKGIKEVTEAVNECVAALEKLERLTNKFSGLARGGIVSVPVTLNGNTISESVSKIQGNDESIRLRKF